MSTSQAIAGPGDIAPRPGDLRRYLAGRFLAGVGSQVQSVAVGWHVFTVTGDPLDLGLVALSQFLPFVLLILPAGHVADRYDRRRVQVLTYSVMALGALGLLAIMATGQRDTRPIFAVMAMSGVARAFHQPTSQALLPNLAGPGGFPRALALTSTLGQIATIGGPALGGLLVLGGVEIAFAIALAMFLAATVQAVRLRGGGRPDRSEEPVSWSSLLSGLAFVRSRPIVLGAISLDLFAVLFGGAEAMLPIYAGDILDVGPAGLGVMRAAPAVGAAALAAVLVVRPLRRHFGRWMFGGIFVFGVATIVFGLSTVFVLSLVALVAMGAADMVSVYVRHLLVQLETPDAIRGRVSAVNAVFIGASNELGEFESGLTAAWWGVVPAVIVGGLATIAVGALWSRLFPSLRRLDRMPGGQTG